MQVGWIWGVGSVLGILVGLIGGPLGDRFGPRRTLAVACLFMGIAGAASGLSNSFAMLALTTLLTGFAQWSIPMNVHKTCGVWFAKERLGMANGGVSVGMALGFLLGSLLAATVFSPLLGGWRNVLFVYGAVAILFGIVWLNHAIPLAVIDTFRALRTYLYRSSSNANHRLALITAYSD